MPKAAGDHDACVFGTPWPGIHMTRIDSGRHYPRHWHTTYGFGVIERGAHRSASGRGQVDAHAGEVITNNPGEVHDGRPIDGKRLWRMLYLEPAAFAALAGSDAAASCHIELTRPVIADPPLRRALHSLFERLERRHANGRATDGDGLACDEALASVGALLLRGHSTLAQAAAEADTPRDGNPSPGLQRVRDRLADDLANAPSLDALAELAGLGRHQLLRRFRKAYGLPPHAWLLHQRAERARALVRAGTALGEAAIDAGFADQSHMTRLFVRQFGFTPGAWQRATRRGLAQ